MVNQAESSGLNPYEVGGDALTSRGPLPVTAAQVGDDSGQDDCQGAKA